jgi:hypothetical protein
MSELAVNQNGSCTADHLNVQCERISGKLNKISELTKNLTFLKRKRTKDQIFEINNKLAEINNKLGVVNE